MLSILAKIFVCGIMVAPIVGVIGFFRIMAKGPDKGIGGNNQNSSGLMWL